MTAETPAETPDSIATIIGRGWTPDKRLRFLDLLAHHGNARAAASEVGLSVQTAYRLRRRDALFARGWNAALVLARDSSEQVLADVAINGIAEEVWCRGRMTGTKIRFDTRLLLAHLGRLDRLVGDQVAMRDAGRFDQLLACVAGEEPAPEIVHEDDPVPGARPAVMKAAAERALDETIAAWEAQEVEYEGEPDKYGYTEAEKEAERAHVANCDARADEAWNTAGSLWDEWSARAVATVDSMIVDKYWSALTAQPANPLPGRDETAPEKPSGHRNLRNPGDNPEPPVTPGSEGPRTH